MHGTGAFTSFQALFVGAGDRHARDPPLRPARAVADGAARARHADGDRRRRVRQADAARARGGRGRRARPTTSRRSQLDHQLGRDVVGRGEAGAHGARQHASASTRSARARASGFAGSISAPGSAPTTAKFTIGASTQGVHRRRPRGRARLRRDRPARGRRPHPGRLLQGRDASRRRRSATINGQRWSVPGDFARVEADGTIDAARPRLGRASTPAARRSSPKRSRKR